MGFHWPDGIFGRRLKARPKPADQWQKEQQLGLIILAPMGAQKALVRSVGILYKSASCFHHKWLSSGPS